MRTKYNIDLTGKPNKEDYVSEDELNFNERYERYQKETTNKKVGTFENRIYFFIVSIFVIPLFIYLINDSALSALLELNSIGEIIFNLLVLLFTISWPIFFVTAILYDVILKNPIERAVEKYKKRTVDEQKNSLEGQKYLDIEKRHRKYKEDLYQFERNIAYKYLELAKSLKYQNIFGKQSSAPDFKSKLEELENIIQDYLRIEEETFSNNHLYFEFKELIKYIEKRRSSILSEESPPYPESPHPEEDITLTNNTISQEKFRSLAHGYSKENKNHSSSADSLEPVVDWRYFVNLIRNENMKLSSLMASSSFELVGNTLKINVPFKFYAERIAEESSQKLILKIFKNLTGTDAQISIQVSDEDKPDPAYSQEAVNRPKSWRDSASSSPRIIDFQALNLVKQETGEIGEELVLAKEKEFLSSIGRKDLVHKVVHSSKVYGDGLGYDIQSFDENGNEIYIEVKATTGDFNSSLFMTRKEIEFVKNSPGSYYLYRVYELNKTDKTAKIRTYRGSEDLLKDFSFKASQYKLTPNSQSDKVVVTVSNP